MSEDGDRRQKIYLVVAIVLFCAAGVWAYMQMQGNAAENLSYNRVFVCAKTGKPYNYEIKAGDKQPYFSPFSDGYTGYIAEVCYWMKDANGEYVAKTKPTVVLLRKHFEPGADTFCPDCGKEVVGHNPMPPDDLMQAAKAAGR